MKKYILYALWAIVLIGVVVYALWEPAPPQVQHATGVHIMADGSVMSNEGPVPGASVLPDGTVRMSDGSVVTPVADFRQK